jgi:hypothetical protein
MSYFINAALPYLVKFIEDNEPLVAEKITSALESLKKDHPDKVPIFKSKWNLLNSAVQKALEEPAPASTSGGKRTRRRRRKHRK